MSSIIAGTFDNVNHANVVKEALLNLKEDTKAISLFHNNAQGQHDTFPMGGDEDKDPGADRSHLAASGGAAIGAAGLGMAAAVGGGPMGVVAALGVGAYTGSLIGALSGTDDDILCRRAGVMVAVKVENETEGMEVIKVFQDNGAQFIEQATGIIEDGDWLDFNPLSVPCLIDKI